MGTNYYMHRGRCSSCLKHYGAEPLHIGKSSAGWCFALARNETEGLLNLSDWIKAFSRSDVTIMDEYGKKVSAAEMVVTITCRHREDRPDLNSLEYGDAYIGPGNMLRTPIGNHCVAHGAGPWDIFIGEFS